MKCEILVLIKGSQDRKKGFTNYIGIILEIILLIILELLIILVVAASTKMSVVLTHFLLEAA